MSVIVLSELRTGGLKALPGVSSSRAESDSRPRSREWNNCGTPSRGENGARSER